ncbi:MAG: 30S ribosomal protein S1 [Bryobacterales bacterium]|nr:30S ribosomal protein S1 [Bryobacteraceae bacterium]MDW8129167.1 30S ribosomal protein S1 [Bryobacterales bacterium]
MAREQDEVRPRPPVPPGEEEDYQDLLEDYGHFAPPGQGEIFEGRVLKVTDKEVIVDFGYKTEGLVPIEQFVQPDGRISVQPGDVVDVMVDRGGVEVDGYILLSHEKAVRLRAWENLEKAYRERLLVNALVLGRTKGGLTVDVGVKAFMPASHIDVRPVPHPESFVGQYVPVRILKLNRRRGNVVVSRKLAVEEEMNARKAAILEALEEGALLTGVVKSLTDYGAFVDLGGLDGLLHVSDMSYGRVNHPSEVLNVGDEITVKVLKVDREKERISLGLKQLLPDPWETAAERYPVGSRVLGRVVSVTDYGAFVELEPGIEGLIHITEMTWSRRLKHPSKVVKVGDQVQAVVLSVQPTERRISLGIKQLEPDPWTTVEQRYSVGSVVEGRVRKLTDFGAFVEIEEGIDGLVHISDLTWSKRVKHPSEVLKKGQMVRAVVLHIDGAARRLSLGIKQLQPDAWETFFRSHQVGDVVRGRVSRAANFGVFVELAEGVEGLCHNSEIPGASQRAKGEPPLEIGREYDFKIIRLSEAEKRIGLSIRALHADEERSRLIEYQRQAASATMTIEEVMNLKTQGEAR